MKKGKWSKDLYQVILIPILKQQTASHGYHVNTHTHKRSQMDLCNIDLQKDTHQIHNFVCLWGERKGRALEGTQLLSVMFNFSHLKEKEGAGSRGPALSPQLGGSLNFFGGLPPALICKGTWFPGDSSAPH